MRTRSCSAWPLWLGLGQAPLAGGQASAAPPAIAPMGQSSRWYPGAGLYRHVWLDVTGPVHVARWGTFVTTPAVDDARAAVAVRTELQNRTAAAKEVTPATALRDASGREVGKSVAKTIRVEDEDGNLCPLADTLLHFKVEGAGRIAAVDNGNPATLEPFLADHRKAFGGLALLVVRARRGSGPIRITAGAAGLPSAKATLRAEVK